MTTMTEKLSTALELTGLNSQRQGVKLRPGADQLYFAKEDEVVVQPEGGEGRRADRLIQRTETDEDLPENGSGDIGTTGPDLKTALYAQTVRSTTTGAKDNRSVSMPQTFACARKEESCTEKSTGFFFAASGEAPHDNRVLRVYCEQKEVEGCLQGGCQRLGLKIDHLSMEEAKKFAAFQKHETRCGDKKLYFFTNPTFTVSIAVELDDPSNPKLALVDPPRSSSFPSENDCRVFTEQPERHNTFLLQSNCQKDQFIWYDGDGNASLSTQGKPFRWEYDEMRTVTATRSPEHEDPAPLENSATGRDATHGDNSTIEEEESPALKNQPVTQQKKKKRKIKLRNVCLLM